MKNLSYRVILTLANVLDDMSVYRSVRDAIVDLQTQMSNIKSIEVVPASSYTKEVNELEARGRIRELKRVLAECVKLLPPCEYASKGECDGCLVCHANKLLKKKPKMEKGSHARMVALITGPLPQHHSEYKNALWEAFELGRGQSGAPRN